MEKGLGINYEMTVPPLGLRLPDLRRRERAADPGEERRATTPTSMSVHRRAGDQSPNTAFIKLEEFTGVPDVVDMAVRLGMKSLATTPFVDPNTGRRTDRSIAEVTKAQKQASFTLGVSPTSVLELANVGATLASGGQVVPAQPRSSRSPTRTASRCRSPRPPCDQAVEPGLANTLLTALSKDDQPGGTAGGRGRAGGLEPADGGQDRHHPAAQVGGVRRGRPADGRGGDHLRQLQLPPPAVRRRRGPVPVPGRQHLRREDPRRDLVRGDETAAGRPAGAAAAADRPALHRRRRRVARSPTSSAAARTTPARSCERAGWKVSTRTVDNRADRGTVVGQNPNGTALPGETILLQISTGEVPPPPAPPGDSGDNGDNSDNSGDDGGDDN